MECPQLNNSLYSFDGCVGLTAGMAKKVRPTVLLSRPEEQRYLFICTGTGLEPAVG